MPSQGRALRPYAQRVQETLQTTSNEVWEITIQSEWTICPSTIEVVLPFAWFGSGIEINIYFLY